MKKKIKPGTYTPSHLKPLGVSIEQKSLRPSYKGVLTDAEIALEKCDDAAPDPSEHVIKDALFPTAPEVPEEKELDFDKIFFDHAKPGVIAKLVHENRRLNRIIDALTQSLVKE